MAAFGTPGDPTLAIFRPRGRHFAAPGRHPRHHAEKTCILVVWRCQKVRVLQGAGSEYIYIYIVNNGSKPLSALFFETSILDTF